MFTVILGFIFLLIEKVLSTLERQPNLVTIVGKLVPNTVVNGSGLEGAAAIVGNALGGKNL